MSVVIGSKEGGRRRRGVSGVAALVTAVLLGSGCYSYQEIEQPTPPPFETVRVELTGAGRDNLRSQYGLSLGRVEGRMLDDRAEQLQLEVRLDANRLAGANPNGDIQSVLDTVSVARADIREVQVKQFSTSRTFLATVVGIGAAIGAYGLMDAALSGDENSGEQGGGGDNFSLVPVITTVLGWLR